MKKMTLDEKIDIYVREGECPADIDHLPERVQEALVELRITPMIKECYTNSQRFLIHNEYLPEPFNLEYHEGIVTGIIPFEHAWLTLEGDILDLTLSPDREYPIEYLDSVTYSVEQVRANMVETEMWTSLTSPYEFARMHPLMKEYINGR